MRSGRLPGISGTQQRASGQRDAMCGHAVLRHTKAAPKRCTASGHMRESLCLFGYSCGSCCVVLCFSSSGAVSVWCVVFLAPMLRRACQNPENDLRIF